MGKRKRILIILTFISFLFFSGCKYVSDNELNNFCISKGHEQYTGVYDKAAEGINILKIGELYPINIECDYEHIYKLNYLVTCQDYDELREYCEMKDGFLVE